jgi:arabinogalactan oligomer/maltooligosaccharide transport system substrate-binding protein
MSRNKFVVLVLVLALLLGSFNAVLAQGTTLKIWADADRTEILLGLAEEVRTNLGIELVIENPGDVRAQILVAGPVGEGPDVFLGAHDWLGQLVANGAVAPVNLGDKAENFLPFTLAAFQYNGVQYGVPYAYENIALVRNVDLVPTAPTTWQEVRAIGEAFQAEGGPYAFALQLPDPYHAYPILTAFGGYTFGTNEDGSYNPADVGFANEGGLAAAQWLSDMYKDGLMPAGVHNDEIFALFEEGNLAMFMSGPWFSERIAESGINYSLDALPGSEGGLAQGVPFSGVQGFMISGYSENQLLAEIFLVEYAATLELQQQLFDVGRRAPAFIGVDTSADANVAGFIAAGTSAVPMPAIPEMGATWSAAGDAYVLISQGEDPVTSFTNAQTQIVETIAASQAMAAAGRTIALVGSLQAAAGCAGDWDPTCETTFMVDGGEGIYTYTVTLPAGEYEYKVAVNGSWDENYGADGVSNGDNIALSLAEETEVTFTYDDSTHLVTDSVNNP